MAEENENLIKNVDLNGSLISHQNLEDLTSEKDREEVDGNPSKKNNPLTIKRNFQFCERI